MRHPNSPFELHFGKRDDCVTCDSTVPVCNCAADENCAVVGRTCNQCASISCTPKSATNGGGSTKTVNAGEIAGPVVAGVVLIVASLVVWFLFRRRRARDLAQVEAIARATLKAQQAGFQLSSHPGSPRPGTNNSFSPIASPSSSQRRDPNFASPQVPTDVQSARSIDAMTFGSGTNEWSHLQRSPQGPLGQPAEGTRKVYGEGSINLDPGRSTTGRVLTPQASFEGLGGEHNPFDDRRSIATDAMSFGSTNVIPIAYVPSSPTGEWPPSRPARSPDLNLRIGAKGKGEQMELLGQPSSSSARNRASFQTSRTNHSIAPSFFSSQSEFEAPQIVTGKQVNFGQRMLPEVVQLDGSALKLNTQLPPPSSSRPSPLSRDSAISNNSNNSNRSDPFDDKKRLPNSHQLGPPTTLAHAASHTTFGASTPTSADDLGPPIPGFAAPSGGADDFRFSMGSLGLGGNGGSDRDSISTMGTGRFTSRDVTINQAQKVYIGKPIPSPTTYPVPPPPRQIFAGEAGPRESMMSGRSEADSFLGSFPIIPPNAPTQSRQRIPQSMSGRSIHETMMSSIPSVPRPPVTAAIEKHAPQGGPRSRSDSTATTATGRTEAERKRQTAMSGYSEGLGGFDFSFDEGGAGGDVPPVPKRE